MGQANSSSSSCSSNSSSEHIIPETVSVIQDELIRQARVITEIAVLSYEDFIHCLEQLNELSRKVTDHSGKQLLFAVKKGTDSTVLWKGTVKIACVKLDPETRAIESHRLFNLNQFLKIFKTLECQLTAALQSSQNEMMKSSSSNEKETEETSRDLSLNSNSYLVCSKDSSSENSGGFQLLKKIKNLISDGLIFLTVAVSSNSTSTSENELNENRSEEKDTSTNEDNLNRKRPHDIKLRDTQMKKFTASMLLEEVDNLANSISDKLGECSICLERKPDVMLPCTHAYCMPCIEQWNTWHKTCPFCRETLDNTDDTWVISDIPGSQEISDEICSGLMDLISPE